MKARKPVHKALVSLSLTLFVCTSMTLTALCQTETLGIVRYTPPKGWDKTAKENVVAFSELNRDAGTFCILTLYGATPSTGQPESDFKRAWNNLVVKPLKAEANPKTATEAADGWTVIAGGAAVEVEGAKAAAFLTVISGGGKTVSILGVFNDQSYTSQLAAFGESIKLEKDVAETPEPQRDNPSPRAASPDIAPMHAAALVKEFETNEVRANQTYVGKRVRVYGTVNNIEIEKDGRIVLTFKSSVSTYNNARCFFSKAQSSRVAELNTNAEATVEGTVRGLGGGFVGTKSFLLLENCVVP